MNVTISLSILRDLTPFLKDGFAIFAKGERVVAIDWNEQPGRAFLIYATGLKEAVDLTASVELQRGNS